mmetsp:Transcript_37079/g.107048  ORF Transcript_37079/g.107048 Transcript_37079/m.107048 type:complete len:376 (-) Transcript_37079:502-1629(-)
MAVFVQGVCKDVEWLGEGWGGWSARSYSIAINLIFILTTSRTVSEKMPLAFRMHLGSILTAVGALGLMGSDLFLRDVDNNNAMAVALFFIILIGAGGSFLQGAILGLAGALHARTISAFMVGQGLAGVLTGIIGMPLGDSRIAMAVVHVLLALMTLAVVPIICCGVGNNPLLKPLLYPEVQNTNGGNEREVASRMMQSSGQDSCATPHSGRSAPQLMVNAWPMVCTVFFTFFVTFLVFPSVAVMWQPVEHIKLVMATFQFMDVAGRAFAEVKMFRIDSECKVMACAALRIVFIPLFMVLQREEAEWARMLSVKVASMALFAFTSGYVSTLAMMLGPLQDGIRDEERSRIGSLLGFGTVHGIFWGSMLSVLTQIGV